MKCPRCHGEVPTEATHCPDCRLPKPKSLVAQAENKKDRSQPAAKQTAAKQTGAKGRAAQARKPRRKRERKLPRWISLAAGGLSVVLLAAVGVYVYLYFAKAPGEIDPHLAQPAMQKLRQMPSRQANLTVEQYLNQELEKSRRIGNLASVQGWTLRPVQGSHSKMLIAFSFQERDNTERRAEWLADLAHDTFTPQTEMASNAFRP
ncbi:MAG TPA: hypothetical protein VKA60_26070 [Blastocatellia bacterium]|nr:hypothetical protein [Blastocatellia bacterium]